MDLTIVLFLILLFLLCGGGGFLVYQNTKPIINQMQTNQKPTTIMIKTDAVLGPWTPRGKCRPLSGACGRGELKMERKCSEGRNGGKLCSEFGIVERTDECYTDCPRPTNIVDWGYSNNDLGNPPSGPSKGWYDVTGQGQPNDYCRWVGESGKRFWACHTHKSPYVTADPEHITFSAGPANTLKPFKADNVRQTCPNDASVLLLAQDPDLKKSIANGFLANCSSRCVYDHRNPNFGWTFENNQWRRVDNMLSHSCGSRSPQEYQKAVDNYDRVYDVKHSWNIV